VVMVVVVMQDFLTVSTFYFCSFRIAFMYCTRTIT